MAKGQSHAEALNLLKSAHSGSDKHLRRLLDVKSKAEYTPTAAAQADLTSAAHAATQLLEQARTLS